MGTENWLIYLTSLRGFLITTCWDWFYQTILYDLQICDKCINFLSNNQTLLLNKMIRISLVCIVFLQVSIKNAIFIAKMNRWEHFWSVSRSIFKKIFEINKKKKGLLNKHIEKNYSFKVLAKV